MRAPPRPACTLAPPWYKKRDSGNLAFAHFSQHSAGNTVIEEQTGVEIIRQDLPISAYYIRWTSRELALRSFSDTGFSFCRSRVLTTPVYSGGNTEHWTRLPQYAEQTLPRFAHPPFSRRIFLNHRPVAVTVYRHVGIPAGRHHS